MNAMLNRAALHWNVTPRQRQDILWLKGIDLKLCLMLVYLSFREGALGDCPIYPGWMAPSPEGSAPGRIGWASTGWDDVASLSMTRPLRLYIQSLMSIGLLGRWLGRWRSFGEIGASPIVFVFCWWDWCFPQCAIVSVHSLKTPKARPFLPQHVVVSVDILKPWRASQNFPVCSCVNGFLEGPEGLGIYFPNTNLFGWIQWRTKLSTQLATSISASNLWQLKFEIIEVIKQSICTK